MADLLYKQHGMKVAGIREERVRRTVSCPVCRVPKGKRCLRMVGVAPKKPQGKRRTMDISHDARFTKYEMFCEAL